MWSKAKNELNLHQERAGKEEERVGRGRASEEDGAQSLTRPEKKTFPE